MDRDPKNEKRSLPGIGISDDDIYEAMKEIPGYLDITPGDLKELYYHAYLHALERISAPVRQRSHDTRVHFVREKLRFEMQRIFWPPTIFREFVLDEDMHVVGIISEKDFCSHMGDCHSRSLIGVIANCLKNQGCIAMTLSGKKAEDIMTSPVITVHEDAVLRDIKALLTKNGINRVPVIDHKGCLTGIVSRADIVRFSFEKRIDDNK
jgi:CBS-domain-containing membrane protein